MNGPAVIPRSVKVSGWRRARTQQAVNPEASPNRAPTILLARMISLFRLGSEITGKIRTMTIVNMSQNNLLLALGGGNLDENSATTFADKMIFLFFDLNIIHSAQRFAISGGDVSVRPATSIWFCFFGKHSAISRPLDLLVMPRL